MKLILKINGVKIWPELMSQDEVHWRTLVKTDELPDTINREVILNNLSAPEERVCAKELTVLDVNKYRTQQHRERSLPNEGIAEDVVGKTRT
jgi:hypothetical protein